MSSYSSYDHDHDDNHSHIEVELKMYSTTSYQIDVPDDIWKEFSDIHDERDRLNNPIVEKIAEDVREHRNGDLDPGVRAEITRIIGGENDGI